jgi:polysaccharide chain length determinant protein (PEP-CTERM system associated)
MQEILNQIMTEIRGAWRFRWVAMVIAWIICIVGWPAVFMLPDQFEAEARFHVDTTTRLDEVMGGVIISADEFSQIELVRQAMLSTPVLETVARETDLDLRAHTPEEKQALIASLQSKINIRSTSLQRSRNEGIYSITYRDLRRNKSLLVVSQLLDTFREDVISGRAEGSDETIEFLTREIDQYAEELRGLERALAEFKKNNVGLLPGESGGYFVRMQQAMADVRSLEAEMSVLVDRRTALAAQLRGESPAMPGDGAGGYGSPTSEIDDEINDLEDTIDNLLTIFTEKWPDVIAARSQLEQLQQRRDKLVSDLGDVGNATTGVASNNPVYQQIQIALNETIVEIAALERQLADRRMQVSDLQARVDIVPEVEANLAQLTRDYDQIRAVYGQLRARLEQEELRQKRIGWDGVEFRVIDPPKVGFEPVTPNRTRLLMLVVIGGLIVGAGIAYLLQLLKPVFIDANSLRKVTGLPVLGSVGMTFKSRHRGRRNRELGWLIGSIALMLVLFVLVLLFEDLGVEAGARIRQVTSL